MSDVNPEEAVPQDGHTLEEWRALGSAEANAWTITSPGGQPMTLSEHAAKAEQEQAALDSAEFRATTFVIDGKPMSFAEMQQHHAASDSAEIQATTFVVDGIPMSFDEMVAYRAKEAERQAAQKQRTAEAAAEIAETIIKDDIERRRIRRELGIDTPD